MATEPKLLKKFTCFEGLSDDQLASIAQISNSVCYLKGHVLFKEGEPGECLYLLIEGDMGVVFQSSKTGESKIDTISSVEVLGCAAMVSPYRYTATQKCLSDVEVLEIKQDELRDLINQDPDIGLTIQQHIIKVLTDRILAIRQRYFG
jgi:CRP-like cAMP-binding protein